MSYSPQAAWVYSMSGPRITFVVMSETMSLRIPGTVRIVSSRSSRRPVATARLSERASQTSSADSGPRARPRDSCFDRPRCVSFGSLSWPRSRFPRLSSPPRMQSRTVSKKLWSRLTHSCDQVVLMRRRAVGSMNTRTSPATSTSTKSSSACDRWRPKYSLTEMRSIPAYDAG
jgi:hypothetical protein